MFMGRTLVFGFSLTLDHVYKILLNTIDKILLYYFVAFLLTLDHVYKVLLSTLVKLPLYFFSTSVSNIKFLSSLRFVYN
jgi:hypothetical protein